MPTIFTPYRALLLAVGVLMGTAPVLGADFSPYRDHPSGAKVHGTVVREVCKNTPRGYIACRGRPIQAAVNVTLVEVDGSVHSRQIFTNRAGRFSVRVAPNRYYVFTPLTSVPGLETEPLEMTVPPGGTTIKLRVEAPENY